MRFFIYIFIAIAVNIPANSTNLPINSIVAKFEPYVAKVMEDWQAPGAAVVIVKDGKVVYEKSFGVKTVGEKSAFDTHTVLPIASVSKNFLVSLIAQLVDEGLLEWDKPVTYYLPEFKLKDDVVSRQITLRDLISHCSGLKAFSGDSFWNLGWNTEEIKQGLAQLPLRDFRKDYAYQNHLFGIASQLVEKVTGKSIAQLLRERFFKPLGMGDSSVGPQYFCKYSGRGYSLQSLWLKLKQYFGLSPAPNYADIHSINNGKVTILNSNPKMYTFNGSTGVNTSIHDLGKWLIFHLNNCILDSKSLISPEQQQQMQTPQVLATKLRPDDCQFPAIRMRQISYGMGWFLNTYGEGDKIVAIRHHMGAFAGVRSLITLVPEHNLGIAIISNIGGIRVSCLPEALRNKFLDLFLNLTEKDWSTDILRQVKDIRQKNNYFRITRKLQNPRNAFPLNVYVGFYENPLYGKLEIRQINDNLCLVYRNKQVKLRHSNGNEFEFNAEELSETYSDFDYGAIEFAVHNKQAQLVSISLMSEGENTVFKRL